MDSLLPSTAANAPVRAPRRASRRPCTPWRPLASGLCRHTSTKCERQRLGQSLHDTFGTTGGPMGPTVIRSSDYFAHGANFGLEIRY